MTRYTRSYSPEIRERARVLRSKGLTYSEISEALGGEIPKNTISGWVRDIELTPDQKARIKEKERAGAAEGRILAAEWHREQKRQRLQDAEEWAAPIAQQLPANEHAMLIMAAALWLGEGTKRDDVLRFGNSDPLIIKGWMALLRRYFDVDEEKLSAHVVISQGMPEQELKEFWAKITAISLDRFTQSGIKSHPPSLMREGYKGVCVVNYYSAEVSRKISALGWATLRQLTDDDPN